MPLWAARQKSATRIKIYLIFIYYLLLVTSTGYKLQLQFNNHKCKQPRITNLAISVSPLAIFKNPKVLLQKNSKIYGFVLKTRFS